MRVPHALLSFVLACGASRPTAAPAPPPTPTPAIDGSHGAICGWTIHHGPTPAACAAPLECCHPCGGVTGCDEQCLTAAECMQWATVPSAQGHQD